MRQTLILAVVLSALWSSSALAQHDGARVAVYLLTGFGGDAELNANILGVDTSLSPPLEPSVGAGIRAEAALWDYLSLGGMFEVNSFEADLDPFSLDREPALTFDAWVRGRYAIEIQRGLEIEPYIGLPLGFSMLIVDSASGSGDDVLPGWNIGLLFGAYLVSDINLGGFFEIGWRYHQWFHDDPDWNVGGHQFAMNLGVAYLF